MYEDDRVEESIQCLDRALGDLGVVGGTACAVGIPECVLDPFDDLESVSDVPQRVLEILARVELLKCADPGQERSGNRWRVACVAVRLQVPGCARELDDLAQHALDEARELSGKILQLRHRSGSEPFEQSCDVRHHRDLDLSTHDPERRLIAKINSRDGHAGT